MTSRLPLSEESPTDFKNILQNVRKRSCTNTRVSGETTTMECFWGFERRQDFCKTTAGGTLIGEQINLHESATESGNIHRYRRIKWNKSRMRNRRPRALRSFSRPIKKLRFEFTRSTSRALFRRRRSPKRSPPRPPTKKKVEISNFLGEI